MILRRPVFWLILVFAALMAFVPLHANNVSMREDLILVAIAIILASNLNLMIGYTGYVNFGHIVFYGLGATSDSISPRCEVGTWCWPR